MLDANVRRLMMAIDRIDEIYYRAQHESGMKESLFVLAYALADGKPRSQKRIIEEWAIPRSTLNTTVIEQVREGNVELVASGHKEKLVTLTEQGRRNLLDTLEPLFEAERNASHVIDAERLAWQMERFATALESAMTAMTQPSCNNVNRKERQHGK